MIQSPWFWLLLLASVLTFWLLPARLRMLFLALVSIAYLAVIAPTSAAPFFGWAILFYFAAPLAAPGKRRRFLVLAILILLMIGYLACFKYLPPLIATIWAGKHEMILVPLGISYFTFKFIHYAIEVARGNIVDRSLPRFLAYLFLFPTVTAGPIERFDHFLANRQTKWDFQLAIEGLTRIIHGLIKKFFFAEMLLASTYDAAASPTLLTAMHAVHIGKLWLLAMGTYLYIYMDFAGYSDIAMGASLLFGLRIMENFNWPFLAPNISEFWKRWHMTLAGWCQSYVYMPVIGWTRNIYLALYATFITIGLWHAAAMNWVFWGAYHATGIIGYQAFTRAKRRNKWTQLDRMPWNYLAIVLTFLFVSAGEIATVAGDHGAYQSLRVLGRLIWIRLPA